MAADYPSSQKRVWMCILKPPCTSKSSLFLNPEALCLVLASVRGWYGKPGKVVRVSSSYKLRVSQVVDMWTALLTYAVFCSSGISASTLLISDAPKPVIVRLCLGLVMPAGPIGPESSATGADVDGLRDREGVVVVAMITMVRVVWGVRGFEGGEGQLSATRGVARNRKMIDRRKKRTR